MPSGSASVVDDLLFRLLRLASPLDVDLEHIRGVPMSVACLCIGGGKKGEALIMSGTECLSLSLSFSANIRHSSMVCFGSSLLYLGEGESPEMSESIHCPR